MNFINWQLVRSPLNWIIVILMLAFGFLALSLVDPLGVGDRNAG